MMTEPSPTIGPPLQVTNPLQWQFAHGQAPDGTKVCLLQLNQGALNVQLQLNVHDMDRLGRALVQATDQARTGLIIPNGAVHANGHGS